METRSRWWRAALGVLASGGIWGASGAPASAQAVALGAIRPAEVRSVTRVATGRPGTVPDRGVERALAVTGVVALPRPILPAEEKVADGPTPSTSTVAEARVEGTSAPGLRIVLDASGSTGDDLRFLWLQTRGPAATIGRADSARVEVSIPGDATELGFAVVVAGRGGVARKDVTIPLLLVEPAGPPEAALVADAGDDQTAIVGHRVTLNGARSAPREGLAYRWLQVEGPKPGGWSPSRWACSFVPIEPGLYRFLLVVSRGEAISEGSEVRVLAVARPPAGLSRGARGDAAPAEPAESVAASGLGRAEAGSTLAADLADDFDEVADRIGLYRAYADVYSEISRRLEATLPSDPAARSACDRELIAPLSAMIGRVMASTGLDPTRADDAERPMTPAQRARLASTFRAVARGCRAAAGLADEGDPARAQVATSARRRP